MTIASRIESIRLTLPPCTRLIAVSKQVSSDYIRQAYQAGVRDFAESKLQEAISKQQELKDLPGIFWHFIGHLQANKARKVLESFDLIHSLDSLKLAQRLDRLAGELEINPQVLLQVKVVPDPDKFGWDTAELLADIPALVNCKQLKIQGLMTILPQGLSAGEKLAAFEKTGDLAQIIENSSSLCLPHLSMGMSNDYPLAIKAGATLIRVGTSIFGDRIY
jgi:pyridoxal phosphate enzyme (YggS family)